MIVGALEIQMMADLARLRKDMAEVNTLTTRAADTASVMADRIRAAFAALGVGAAVRQFVEIADNMALMEARVKIATKTTEDFNQAQKNIYDISQRNMTSLESTTKVFARLNPIVEKLGGDIKYTSAVSDALAAALRVSGASTQEASSVMIQFSQAMSSGALRGEEFNSVSENGSRVLDALSNQLGKSRGELRKMAEQGQLTAGVVGNALVKELAKLRAEAASMPLTVGAAFQRLQNDLAVFTNELNKSYGITRTIAEGLEFLRHNLEAVSSALVTGAKVAAAYFVIFKGGPLLVAGVTTALQALVGALASFATGGVLASGTATAMTGVWATLTTGTLTLTTAVTGLQLALGVIFAAFVGWEIGKWARENFVEVELFGIAMVNGLLKSWEYLKFGFNAVVESIVWAWEKAIGSIQGFIGWFLENFAEGLRKLGLSESAAKVMEWADSFKNVSKEVKTLDSRLDGLRKARDKELAQIDALTGELADYAVETHEAKKAVEKHTGAVKLLNEATVDEKAKKEAAAKAAKALKEAQEQLDKSTKQLVDTILDEIDATLKANEAVQKQIADIKFETEALQMTNTERALAIELRKLEQAGIEKGTEAYEEYAAQIREAVLERSRVEESVALAKKQAEEIQKINDEIGQSLTDSLLRAFESGKDFFSTFWSGIKNTFKTTVLKMLISPIQQGISGAVGSMLGLGGGSAMASTGGAGGGGLGILGGIMNVVSMGKSLWGALSGGVGSIQTSLLNAADWLVTSNSSIANSLGGFLQGNYASIGTAVGGLGGFLAGRGIGQMVSGGYGLGGGSGNTAVNIGAAIGALAGPIGSIIGGAIGGIVNRAFGRKQKEVQEQGVTGVVAGGDFSGQAFADWFQKGGWFRSDRRGTDMSAMSDELSQVFDMSARAVYSQVQDYAKVLGLPAESLKDVSYQMRVNLTDDAKKNEQAINAAFTAYQSALVAKFATVLQPFQKAGETLVETMARLTALDLLSQSINGLGGIFSVVAGASYGAREAIVGLAGGIEALMGKATAFVQAYYTEEEQAALQARQIREYFAAMGIDDSALNSKEAFRALVEAQDVETELGQKQLVALLDIAPQFAELANYLTEQQTTLAALAEQAPATVALQKFNDRQAEYQAAVDRNTDAVELGNEVTEMGFNDLREAFNDGIAQLNGTINQLNSMFRNWDNGDSLQVSLP